MSDLGTVARTVGETVQLVLPREQRARHVAEAVREAGFRWVGVYEVAQREIVNLAWSGPAAPAFPRFPADRGLSGDAVASGHTVVCNDVRNDPRYLTTLDSTGSEIIVPILDSGRVVGTLDVASEHVGAFDDDVCVALERIAAELPALYDQ